MNNSHRFKLFVMMVLEIAIWGAWFPLIFGYLPSMGFSAGQQTWILNTFPIAAIVGMFFSNQFADRSFAAEKFLAVSHLIGGLAMLGLAFIKAPEPVAGLAAGAANPNAPFWPFFSLMLVHCLLYVPTISITNSIAFTHMKDPQKEFGIVRMGGTIGWILAAWPLAFILVDYDAVKNANPQGFVNWIGTVLGSPLTGEALMRGTKWTFILAGIISFVLAAYSLTLPHTPPKVLSKAERPIGLFRLLFSFYGRIPRSIFWFCWVGLRLFALGLFLFVDATNSLPLLFILVPLLIWMNLATIAKRLHDCGWSAWWILIGLVPIIGGLFGLIVCGFFKSDPGPNRYGTELQGSEFAWAQSLSLLSIPFILILWLVTLIDATVHNLFFNWTGRFLGTPVEQGGVGIAGNWIMPVMSIGQVAEILTMLVLGATLKKLGWRMTMMIGILGHAVRFAVFAFMPQHEGVIIAVNLLHGICYAFFFATVYIFVDEFFPKDARASAQGLFNLMILGLGPLVANAIGPVLIGTTFNKNGVVDFKGLFLIPCFAAIAAAVLLALFFRPPKSREPQAAGKPITPH